MPIYEYECEKCGHKFDHMMRMDDPNPSCPHVPEASNGSKPEPCGGDTKKLISQGTFHLKGGGWYKDGY